MRVPAGRPLPALADARHLGTDSGGRVTWQGRGFLSERMGRGRKQAGFSPRGKPQAPILRTSGRETRGCQTACCAATPTHARPHPPACPSAQAPATGQGVQGRLHLRGLDTSCSGQCADTGHADHRPGTPRASRTGCWGRGTRRDLALGEEQARTEGQWRVWSPWNTCLSLLSLQKKHLVPELPAEGPGPETQRGGTGILPPRAREGEGAWHQTRVRSQTPLGADTAAGRAMRGRNPAEEATPLSSRQALV